MRLARIEDSEGDEGGQAKSIHHRLDIELSSDSSDGFLAHFVVLPGEDAFKERVQQ